MKNGNGSSKRAETDRDSLDRARNGMALTNYPAIYQGFIDKGIAEEAILPRENVFTYGAWRAQGRHVRKGEHGVKVCTFVPASKEETDTTTGQMVERAYRVPKMTTVFHVSQTDADEGRAQ